MKGKSFPEVPGGYPFPELEREVLEFWHRDRTFQRTLENGGEKGDFVFYDGPPTANNVPHVGHVVTRVIKDLFPRYRTMRGWRVPRKAGWDTHGLPVEIEVEKRLGFSGKQQIEEYGIVEFNARCLESVHTYEQQWRAMSERVAHWIDYDHPYFTYSNDYIESVWWSLKRLWDSGLLEEGYKIQPYCARCGTTLSSHEVAQNYQDADDPSVWVLFPVHAGQSIETIDGEIWEAPESLHLVAWTTTPWTLTGHTGIAVHPDMVYRVVEDPSRPGRLLLFGDELETAVPVDAEIEGERQRLDLREAEPVVRIPGAALFGLRYERPFRTGGEAIVSTIAGESVPIDPEPSDENGWSVFTADYVTPSEGTGLVHTAPAFGEDDYQSGRRYGLPLLLTVTTEGTLQERPGIEPFAGMWFKDADKEIQRDLRDRALLLHGDRYHHNYPFCWRCDQPLVYYASRSWFVLTTRRREALAELNRTIDWHPEHVGEGRFGNWLENVVDWALSRKRYWGTPLPIWRCDSCDHIEAVGSFGELFERANRQPPDDILNREQFDPHRPFVDRDAPEEPFVWSCPEEGCGGTVGRVDDVIDAWYDSGSMPFAQHHYMGEPLELEDGSRLDPEAGIGFPADFISEAIDQTRGWFYTLHALGVLLFDSVAYRTCIVLGHINDEKGRKMSKRLGNVVEPMEVIETTGADAIRWYFCINNPEVNSRFSARLVREAAQSYLLPLWNALSFFSIYANLDDWHPDAAGIAFDDRPALDRWILLRLDRLTDDVTEGLESYDVTVAAASIEAFVDALTNWYIRRSRDRFWAPVESDARDKESAYQTLYEVLTTLSRLVAPFTPFVAEMIHQHLVRTQNEEAPTSVHLTSWPEGGRDRRDDALVEGMDDVLRIVRLARAARTTHELKTRQPLASVTVATPQLSHLRPLVEPFEDLMLEELNVKRLDWAEDPQEYAHHEVRPNFTILGPRHGKRMPAIKKALEDGDGDQLAHDLHANGQIVLEIDGETVELGPEDVEIRLIEKEGLATEGSESLLVALDTELTPELLAEGLAREVVNRIQTARKKADLDYADRIRVRYQAPDELADAIQRHEDWILGETLTETMDRVTESAHLEPAPVGGLDFGLAISRIEEE